MEKKEKKSEYKLVLDCLHSVVWYNGYSDFFRDVHKAFKIFMEEGGADKHDGYFSIWKYLELEGEPKYQIQVLRMMLVEMFGDYGTSPRYGWIVDEKGFDEFMKELIDMLPKDED